MLPAGLSGTSRHTLGSLCGRLARARKLDAGAISKHSPSPGSCRRSRLGRSDANDPLRYKWSGTMVRPIALALTRRHFLGTGAAVFGAGALPTAAPAQAARFRRWKITDPAMPARVLDSYKRGIRAMLGLAPSDPRNWYRHAFVHLFDCPHQNWWFLPWHRGYLGWLETTLRDLSGDADFALPYWDWTKTTRVPAPMFEDVLDPNNSAFIPTSARFRAQFEAAVANMWSAFTAPQRAVLATRGMSSPADFWNQVAAAPAGMFFEQPDARGLTAASPNLDATTRAAVAMATVRSALRTPTFTNSGTDRAGFASAKTSNHSDSATEGILESQPHDNVHGAMGGAAGNAFMVSFLSPVDPIFFLHHGNIDRLWDVWTRRQKAMGRPTLPQGADLAAWSGEKFLFFSDAAGRPVSQTNSGDYATAALFDYDYSPGSGEDQVPAVVASAPAAAESQRFSGRITSSAVVPGEQAGGVVDVPAAALQDTGAAAPPQVAEVTLSLGPADQGRRFRVLVSVEGATPVEAGGITIFSHHVHGPTTFTVPLPEGIATGRAAAASVPLRISVEPLEPATPAASPAERAARAARRQGTAAPRVTAIEVRTN
jgi:tyrosinase